MDCSGIVGDNSLNFYIRQRIDCISYLSGFCKSDGGGVHLVIRIRNFERRIADQQKLQAVAQRIAFAFGQTDKIAHGVVSAIIFRKHLLIKLFVEVVVGAGVGSACGGKQGNAATFGIQENIFASRSTTGIIIARKLTGGGDKYGHLIVVFPAINISVL